MQVLFLLVAFVASAAAMIRCPPIEETRAIIKQAGEACGGACNLLGDCADGLKCMVPESSGINFAILLAPAREGVCTKPEVAAPVAAVNPTGADRRQLAGGIVRADANDEDVKAAAKAGFAWYHDKVNSKTQLTSITSATKQVVAGTKYVIYAEGSDMRTHLLHVLDRPWLAGSKDPRHLVTYHQIMFNESMD